MSEDKSPVDQALDLLVFAPVGLALTARDALPDLIRRGRDTVTSQATMARLVGQFAVQQGQQQAGRALEDARERAVTVLEQLAGDAGGPGVAPPAPVVDVANANGSAPASVEPAPPSSGPGAAELAIPDYDSLAASQVVPRLSGLAPEELEAVRRYETAHRGRKTILSRVGQLQGERS